MLKIENLDKSFNTPAGPVHAVRDVNFSAADGEMVAIIGASGSGKSTLLSLVGLLDGPDRGSIEIDGVELANLDSAGRTKFRARGVGFIFQQFNLIPNLSAKENVELALEFANWPKEDRDRRADEHRRTRHKHGLADRQAVVVVRLLLSSGYFSRLISVLLRIW